MGEAGEQFDEKMQLLHRWHIHAIFHRYSKNLERNPLQVIFADRKMTVVKSMATQARMKWRLALSINK